MSRTRTSGAANKVAAAERRRLAVELRKGGATYREIGDALNPPVTGGRAYAIVKAALDSMVAEGATELRRLELERLDRMQRALWPLVTHTATVNGQSVPDPDLKAIDRVLRIMERRARLMGLDAHEPIELHLHGGATMLDAQETARAVVDEMLTRMHARLQPIPVEANGHGTNGQVIDVEPNL